MAKKTNVSVTWETVQDGMTPPGANLKGILESVLQNGHILEVVGMPSGNQVFEKVKDFSDWFDRIGE